MSTGGASQAWMTVRLAFRRAASSKANVRASAQLSRSPMPTPTRCCGDGGTSRTTTTGQDAWLETYRLTEPKTSAVNAPAPREPTTSMSAPDPLSATARAGGPPSPPVSITSPGAAASALAAAISRASSRLRRSTPDTVSGPVLDEPAAAILGVVAAADTMRSGAPRSADSLAAHSTVCIECSDPSVAATIGLVVIAVLLIRPAGQGAGLLCGSPASMVTTGQPARQGSFCLAGAATKVPSGQPGLGRRRARR